VRAQGGGLRSESSTPLSFSEHVLLGVFILQHQPLCTVYFLSSFKMAGGYIHWKV
jgi:hypothetical protein